MCTRMVYVLVVLSNVNTNMMSHGDPVMSSVFVCAGEVRNMSVFEFVEVLQLAGVAPHHVHENDVRGWQN